MRYKTSTLLSVLVAIYGSYKYYWDKDVSPIDVPLDFGLCFRLYYHINVANINIVSCSCVSALNPTSQYT